MADPDQHISCQEVVELITDYLEAALPPHEAALFEQHLNFCEGCVWYVEQMRGTVQVTGRVAGDDIPAPDRDRLLAAFRGWRTS